MERLDLAKLSVREINQFLHHEVLRGNIREVQLLNAEGQHNIAVGVNADLSIEVLGHAGYFLAGMNKHARVTVRGSVGWSVAENIMSGSVRVEGFASECAGASGHGGLLVIEGSASSRCGISMKGCDIVVGGSVGHMSAFMAQAGHLVICGDAGHGLGDSLYEAIIYVRGKIHSLGADAREEEMTAADRAKVEDLLKKAEINYDVKEFKKVASARELYHWNVTASQEY